MLGSANEVAVPGMHNETSYTVAGSLSFALHFSDLLGTLYLEPVAVTGSVLCKILYST